VAEVDHHDRWQRATLAASLTAGSLDQLERAADRLERFVLDRHPDGVSFERHVASIEDLRG
jgi:uncharacterized protein YlxP (DUF503 family)